MKRSKSLNNGIYSISVPAEIIEEARALEINISKEARRGILQAIEREKRLNEQNEQQD